MSTPTHDRPLPLALVGAGRIAQSYVDVVAASDCVEVVAVADVDEAAAARLARRFGEARSFGSHRELLDAVDPVGVVIATPPATHGDIALAFLSRGVHVLCEKPLAVDVATAQRMIRAADEAGVLLTMAAKFRFAQDVTRARHIVESGILGDLMLFENAFTSRVDMSGRWNADPRIAGGGVLIDNGTHSVDIARFFLGPIGEVMAVEGKRTQQLDVEDTVRVFLRSVDGVIGSIDLSWSMDKSLDHYVSIFGTEGEIRVGWKGSSFRQVASPEWVSFGTGYDKVEAMGGAVRNFCHAILGEEPLLITADDALASVGVIEQAYASLAADHWVPVPAAATGAPARQVRGGSAA
ncbi:MAG: Gfo/Idh/MocA family oxidoreductase [Acidimicrobiales bacterium]|nr:Gfo/Idh/MocA family oxidoreductase [Acidimicrobiales bacterium]MCB1016389.1 Gfo/Idh/MocA family oxidoreductase [Acidimicrobiales bacterium]MCB9372783.1 Gfo/Idh/MocA family oxidoreductase [Microthrixaceae bacterium]